MNRAVACLAVAIISMLSAVAAAECCRDCGCHCDCCKVCRCVPDIKKVPKITYDCECEDFCVPGPSKCCGFKTVCPDNCCGCPLFNHAHREPVFEPGCSAKIYTRHKLIKKEEIKEVCSWKWEVVDLCPHCKSCCKHHHASAEPGTPAAAPARAVADARTADDYYSQNDPSKAGAQPEKAAAAPAPQAELVSHSTPSTASKLKNMLLPMLAK